MVRVKVPATSANLGAGFDCLGMALSLYNIVEMHEAPGGIKVDVEGEGVQYLPRGPENLVIQVARRVFERVGYHPAGLNVRLVNAIPPSRGLGSSSAAICGALVAANVLSGGTLGNEELLQMAVEIEGHPDNVTPAFLGGVTVACMSGRRTVYARFDPPGGLRLGVIIPDRPLSTQEARAALPKTVAMADAVYNIQHACLLVAALTGGRWDLIGEALGDRLPQPYRAPLLPGLAAALEPKPRPGVIGTCLSGSGSTVLVFLEPGVDEETARSSVGEIADLFRNQGMGCRSMVVDPDTAGVQLTYLRSI